MKRALCVILIILLALTPAALADDSSVCFISLNDSLLQLSSQAYSFGGQYYVPISVFIEFRIYSHFLNDSSTAQLYSSSKQMFFNVETGETYDGEDNYYTASAVMRGGTVFVPVDFVCRQFGLSWSYIRGSGYGDVCRITDSSAVLTDEQFLTAARPLMAGRYQEYTGSAVEPSGGEGSVSGETVVFLSFQGLPTMDMLAALEAYGVKATFFLAAEEMLSGQAELRRITGQGHNVGVLCSASPEEEFRAGLDALRSCAKTATVLIASSAQAYNGVCSDYAEEAGLVYCGYNLDGVQLGRGVTLSDINVLLSSITSSISYMRIACSYTTQINITGILAALTESCVVLAACETSVP